jgi:VWFA-related protein
MWPLMIDTRQAASRFLVNTLIPGDRALLVAFSNRPRLIAGPTGQVQDLLQSFGRLTAGGATALYDSIVFALFNSNGLSGQRALVVLTDGVDESSRTFLEQASEFARRSEVAIYPIGIALTERAARKVLDAFAEDTGGRAFYVDQPAELDAVYQAIGRELRSKVLIVYQSSATATDGAFRSIEVEIARRGVRAKTLRGYYP